MADWKDLSESKKHGISSYGNSLTNDGTIGVFTQANRDNPINTGASVGKRINKEIHTIIGPPKSKPKRRKQSLGRPSKKLRIDSLGPY